MLCYTRFLTGDDALSLSLPPGGAVQKPDTLEDLQKMLEDIVKGDEGSRGGGVGVGGRVPPDGARRARVAPYPQQQRR